MALQLKQQQLSQPIGPQNDNNYTTAHADTLHGNFCMRKEDDSQINEDVQVVTDDVSYGDNVSNLVATALRAPQQQAASPDLD